MYQMTKMANLLRLGRRHLHTVISRETIKPSSPTPSHLHTYNLSVIDRMTAPVYMPIVLFYPNNDATSATTNSFEKARTLKKSLSQTLTKYYPFAGRLVDAANGGSTVDCTDEGVDFLEARNDLRLSSFLHGWESNHAALDDLFPDRQVWYDSSNSCKNVGHTNPVAVQLSHFACGGVAVAVSMSHKLGDGATFGSFLSYWSTVSSSGSAASDIDPHFISVPDDMKSITVPQFSLPKGKNSVTKKFVFPNLKLEELKMKIKAMESSSSARQPSKPTRVEALNALLHKSAVLSTNTNYPGALEPSRLAHVLNMRNKLVERVPHTTVGNLYWMLAFPTGDESKLAMNRVTAELKKAKEAMGGVRNVEALHEIFTGFDTEIVKNALNGAYFCTSICRFPFYKLNFGWGNPTRVTLAGAMVRNGYLLMDTPSGDGIEAWVNLEKEDMAVFENDTDIIAFCDGTISRRKIQAGTSIRQKSDGDYDSVPNFAF